MIRTHNHTGGILSTQILTDYRTYLVRVESLSYTTARLYSRALDKALRAGIDIRDKAQRDRWQEDALITGKGAHTGPAFAALDRLLDGVGQASQLVDRDGYRKYLVDVVGLTAATAATHASEAVRFAVWRRASPGLPLASFEFRRPSAITHLFAYADRERPDLFEALGLSEVYEDVVLAAPCRRFLDLLIRHRWTSEVIGRLQWGDLYRLSGGWSTPRDREWYERMASYLPPGGGVVKHATGAWQPIIPAGESDRIVDSLHRFLAPPDPFCSIWREEDGTPVSARVVICQVDRERSGR